MPPAEHEHTGRVPLVGIGFDVHPFSDDPDRALVLGGVVFDGERGLAGHSDADAVAHACCDAILGVAGLGDIGSLFPDDDDRWAQCRQHRPPGRGGRSRAAHRQAHRQHRLHRGGRAPTSRPSAG